MGRSMNLFMRGLDSNPEKWRGRKRNRTPAVVRNMSGAEDTNLAKLAKLRQQCRQRDAQIDAQACELNLLRA